MTFEKHLRSVSRAASQRLFILRSQFYNGGGGCLSVTLLIVDLWQYCVCCIGSGVNRCILIMVMHIPGPNGPVLFTRGALVAHRYTYSIPRCRTSQFRRTFILLLVSMWNDLADSIFDGVGLAANAFLLA